MFTQFKSKLRKSVSINFGSAFNLNTSLDQTSSNASPSKKLWRKFSLSKSKGTM